MDNLVGIIIQARMGSSRLPGKTMKDLAGEPLLYYSVKRAIQSKYTDKVIVATTDKSKDNLIEMWCEDNNISCYRGNENDVLDRYYQCAKENNLDFVVRATADNPFIDPKIIDLLILTSIEYNVDYVTMRHKTNTWPYGLDVEVVRIDALKKAWERASLKEHKEHVTLYIKDNNCEFTIKEVFIENDLSNVRLTVDYDKDFKIANEIMKKLQLQFDLDFSWFDVVDKYNMVIKENDYGMQNDLNTYRGN